MKIALVGDVMLGRLVNDFLKINKPSYPWGNTLQILRLADLKICNLECVMSNIGKPWSTPPKLFHFRSDEKNVSTLKSVPIDMISVANNHVLDYEDLALKRMLSLLKANNIPYAGAGNNFEEASQLATCKIKGKKIGLLAFTDNEPAWAAREDKAGVCYVPINCKDIRAQKLFEKVNKCSEIVDFLIVSAHWGPNWGYEVPEEHVDFAHSLIDAGANLIFGHSGHIFRGIEIYKNQPIIYCAGDFIDDYAVDEIEKNDETFIFFVEVLQNRTRIYLYPCLIQDFQVNLAVGDRKQQILLKMQELCRSLGSSPKCYSDYILLDFG